MKILVDCTQLDERAVHQRTGARLHTSYWPAKIYWLATRHPERAAQVARYVSSGEYFALRVLGRSLCSFSMASGTGLWNMHTHTWDAELLSFLRVSEEHFSPLGDASETLQNTA